MRSLALISALAFAFSAAQVRAQTAPQVKVDIKRVTLQEQPTPDLSPSNVKAKRWRPKNWVEMDVEFDIKLPLDAGGNKGTYGSLQMNVYLALQHSTKDGKRETLTGTFDLQSIPAGEPCHALVYVSPATMKMIFQKDNMTVSSDIQGWGVEVLADGQRIAGDSSLGKDPWWETKKDAFAFIQGLILHKSQTPFAYLWSDYDVPAKVK